MFNFKFFICLKTQYWLLIYTIIGLSLSVIKHLFWVSNFGDAAFRFSPVDSPINMFAFFWTNFWYIPMFFSVLCILGFNITLMRLIAIVFAFSIYTYESYDLSAGGWCSASLSTFQLALNTLLTNNINKYHPCIFYVGAALLLNFFLFTSRPMQQPLLVWDCRSDIYNIFRFSIFGFLTTFVALYLGSWWALQEGTWGGWWNWDASETFGLFLAFAFVRWVHVFDTRNFFYSLSFSVRLFTFLFVTLYFMMQLNFDLISHNFGIKFFFFFNNSFFLLEMLSLFSTVCLYVVYRYLFLHQKKLRARVPGCDPKFKTMFFASFSQFFTIWVFLASFGPVLSYFSWTYANLNLFNELGVHILPKLSFALIILSFYLLVKSNANFFIPLVNFLHYSNPFLALLLLLRWTKVTVQIHAGLVLFLIVNLETHSTQLALALLKTPNFLLSPLLYPTLVGFASFVLDEVSHFVTYTMYPWSSSNLVHQNFLTTATILPLFGFFVNSIICTSSLFSLSEMFYYINFIDVSTINTHTFLVVVSFIWIFWIFIWRKQPFEF